jgi:hypothetical protein
MVLMGDKFTPLRSKAVGTQLWLCYDPPETNCFKRENSSKHSTEIKADWASKILSGKLFK